MNALLVSFIISGLVQLSICSAKSPLRFQVLEEQPAGTAIGLISPPPHLSTVQRAELRYTLRHRDQHIEVSTDSEGQGQLRTTSVIDRESVCPYRPPSCSLELDVVLGPRQYFDIVKVIVEVIDVNDHRPIFPSPAVLAVVVTDCSRRHVVRLPAADDLDSGQFGVQTYRVVADDPTNHPLPVALSVVELFDGSRDVRLDVDVDERTRNGSRYVLNVVATDGGLPPLSGSLRVDVTVACTTLKTTSGAGSDVQFDNSTYRIVIPEASPVARTIARIHATSGDDVVVYRLVNGSGFAIDSETGEISLTNPVDYERAQSHQFVVSASTDTTSLPVFADVTVDVTDVNDNAPIIDVIAVNVCSGCSRHVALIDENLSPEVVVANVSVTDADSGANGQVSCSVTSPRKDFDLRTSGGKGNTASKLSNYQLVSLSTFDRERQSNYHVTIECFDQATPHVYRLTSSIVVDVRIVDTNDNRPVAVTSPIDVIVAENNAVGLQLATVVAWDADEGVNNALTYSVAPGALKSVAASALGVDPDSGAIFARISFDYETQRDYELPVLACDRRGAAVTSSSSSLCSDVIAVRVHVTDVNDERPTFDRKYYQFTVVENRPAGTLIGHVRATDADASPLFRCLTYSLDSSGSSSSNNNAAEFDVDSSTGEIRTIRSLDHELQATVRHQVCAVDCSPPGTHTHGLFHCVNVTVYVLDENDNQPIVHSRQRVRVTLDTVPGSVVAQISATDLDSGLNSRLVYSLVSGDDDNLFDVDRHTGYLYVTAALPQHPAVFNLELAVSDSGQPPLTSLVQLTIEVVVPTAVTSTGSGVNLVVLLVAVGAVVTLVLVVSVAAVLARRRCRQRRRRGRALSSSKASMQGNLEHDDAALASLYADLSRSLDLAARTTLVKSRDMTRSAMTLTGSRINESSMWFSSPDCSASVSTSCQCSSTPVGRAQSRAALRHQRRFAARSRSYNGPSRQGDVTARALQYGPAGWHDPEVPSVLSRLSSDDGTSRNDDITTSELSECTDSGRGHSAVGQHSS